jgi:cytochrome c-type biogenesis protein CcmH/NrfG
MSRLAERLMGMDRGAARPEGVGGIPRLVPGENSARRWSPAVVLAIVVVMVCAGGALVLQSREKVVPVAPVSAPVVPVAPARPAPSDDRVTEVLRRGLLAAEEGRLADAADLLDEATRARPGDAEAWNSLGVVLVRRGETARGVEAFRRALRAKPDHAEAHRNLGVALDRQGRPREAATHYRAFLRYSQASHGDRDDVRRRLAEVSVSSATPQEPR